MSRPALFIILMVMGASCQAILGIEGAKPATDGGLADAETADAEPAPDAISGVDGSCEPVALVAAKVYDPIASCKDDRYLSAAVSFQLPVALHTSDGQPGGHCAQLGFKYGNDPVACIYKGNFSVYELAECRTGATISFDECGGSAAGVLINLAAGTLLVTDEIHLQVHNGDPNQGRTEVTLELTGTCNPDSTASMCIDWNG